MAEAPPAYDAPAVEVLSVDQLNLFFAINPAHIMNIMNWLQDSADANQHGLSVLDRSALADISGCSGTERKLNKLFRWIREDGSGNRITQVSLWLHKNHANSVASVLGKAKRAPAIVRAESPVRLPPRAESPVRLPPKRLGDPLPFSGPKKPILLDRSELRTFFSGRPQALIEACEELHAATDRPEYIYDAMNEGKHLEKLKGLITWVTSSERNRELMANWMAMRAPQFE